MIPTTIEKNSRRSSILKLPKARQPLQNVEPTESSAENSPGRLKRRVSFAEKKHIKEFCDSVEQGTVWDNTYEESDMSEPKNTTTTNHTIPEKNSNYTATNNLPESIPHDSESLLIFDCNSSPTIVSTSEIPQEHDCQVTEATRMNLESIEVNQLILSRDPAFLANKENIPGILTLVRENDEVINQREITPTNPLPGFSIYCDEEMDKNDTSLNVTNIENVSMDCTLPVADSFTSITDEEPLEKDPIDEVVKCISPNLIEHSNHVENVHIQIFNDETLTMTKVVTSTTYEAPTVHIDEKKTQCSADRSTEIINVLTENPISGEKTQYFNRSMDITEVVSRAKPCHTSLWQLRDSNIPFFRDKSVDMAEASTRDETEKETDVVPPEIVCASPKPPINEETKCSPNKSLEMDNVPSNIEHHSAENTQIFFNKPMDMTEAVSSVKPCYAPLQQLTDAKSRFFCDNSMEMTNVVRSTIVCAPTESINDDKTQCFQDKSMELTEAVSSVQRNKFSEEHTHIFHNESMIFTESVPSSNSNHSRDDRTQFFQNNLMEFTEPVSLPSQTRTMNQADCSYKDSESINKSGTSLKRPYQVLMTSDSTCERPKAPRRQGVSSADLEELHRILHEGIEENKLFVSSQQSSNISSNSMDMSTTPPSHDSVVIEQNQEIPPLTTQRVLSDSYTNVEMEMTEVVQPFHFSQSSPGASNVFEDVPDKSSEELKTLGSFVANQSKPNYYQVDVDPVNSSNMLSDTSRFIAQDRNYDLTAPIICHQNVKNLQDTEAPSFLHESIGESLNIPANEFNIIDDHQSMEIVSIPEISLTENVRKSEDYLSQELSKSMNDQDEFQLSQKNTVKQTDRQIPGEINAKRKRTYLIPNDVEKKNQGSTSEMNDDSIKVDITSTEASVESPEACEVENKIISPEKKKFKKQTIQNKKVLNIIASEEYESIIKRLDQQNKILLARSEKKQIREINKTQVESKLKVIEELEDKSIDKSPYNVLEEYIHHYLTLEECEWKVLKLTPERICFEFKVNYMVLGIIFNEPNAINEVESVNRIALVPRLNDLEKPILKLTDYLITSKINLKELANKYSSYDHVPQLIQYVTDEIKLVFDFYDELKRLSYVNIMNIVEDNISFNLWTKSMDIILKVTISMKPFSLIKPDDIEVICILGNINQKDIKDLIKNVKRNHKFLTFYINDIKDYIQLMEEITVKQPVKKS